MSESPEEISGPRRVIGTPSPAPKAGRRDRAARRACLLGRAGQWSTTPRTPSGSSPGCSSSRSSRAADSSRPTWDSRSGSRRSRRAPTPSSPPSGRTWRSARPSPSRCSRSALGSMIWVRHLTPNIEIEEERHDLNVRPGRPGGVPADVRRGRGDLADHQAAARPPDDAAGHAAAGAGAAGAAARPRPAAAEQPADHGLAQGPAGGHARRPAAADAGRPVGRRVHDHGDPRGLPGRPGRAGQGGRDPDQVRARPAERADQRRRRGHRVIAELDDRQHDRRLLQDLHPRGLPGRAVRADHAPHPLPLPPVDVRRVDRGQRDLRPGTPPAAATAADG